MAQNVVMGQHAVADSDARNGQGAEAVRVLRDVHRALMAALAGSEDALEEAEGLTRAYWVELDGAAP